MFISYKHFSIQRLIAILNAFNASKKNNLFIDGKWLYLESLILIPLMFEKKPNPFQREKSEYGKYPKHRLST